MRADVHADTGGRVVGVTRTPNKSRLWVHWIAVRRRGTPHTRNNQLSSRSRKSSPTSTSRGLEPSAGPTRLF